ncbi:hypothetical protein U91I_01500 [alpha proteobacterium U9-1i]|nr:hypothetical protein U91I_01500 [alpha proteobacterium U9-1i]
MRIEPKLAKPIKIPQDGLMPMLNSEPAAGVGQSVRDANPVIGVNRQVPGAR